ASHIVIPHEEVDSERDPSPYKPHDEDVPGLSCTTFHPMLPRLGNDRGTCRHSGLLLQSRRSSATPARVPANNSPDRLPAMTIGFRGSHRKIRRSTRRATPHPPAPPWPVRSTSGA